MMFQNAAWMNGFDKVTRAERSVPAYACRAQAGYTLIEILIVLFIISIVTSVALISISRNENKQMESLANELVQVISLAEEQAMLQPSVLGLSLKGQRLQFSRFQPEASGQSSRWMPIDDATLQQRPLPETFQVRVSGQVHDDKADESLKKQPQIIISTNGDLTPFTIYIGKKGQKPRYAVKGDADGNITSTSLS